MTSEKLVKQRKRRAVKGVAQEARFTKQRRTRTKHLELSSYYIKA